MKTKLNTEDYKNIAKIFAKKMGLIVDIEDMFFSISEFSNIIVDIEKQYFKKHKLDIDCSSVDNEIFYREYNKLVRKALRDLK